MLECIITETKDIEPVVYEWGGVKWVANNDLDPGCEQSFGLCISFRENQPRALAHRRGGNRVHAPGRVRRALGRPKPKDSGPGRTLYIPQGVKHEVANHGWEPVLYVCSFSASMRGTFFENPSGPGVRPLSGQSGSQSW